MGEAGELTGRRSDLSYALHSADVDLQMADGVVGIRRRHQRWPAMDRARITAESFEGVISISAVARRHGVSLGLLHYWRRQVRDSGRLEELRFVPVEVEPETPALRSLVGSIEIEVADVRIRLSGDIDGLALRKVLAAVRA
jgi:transposase